MHILRRVRGYLPGWQRTDARYFGHPQKSFDDGKRVPQTIGKRVQGHGTQHESVECFASRQNEMGGGDVCANHRAKW